VPHGLDERLRLVVVTDTDLAAPRAVVDVVGEALRAGAPAIQLRNKGDSARDLFEVGRLLRERTLAAGALLFVNDRLDVALALRADGVHLGPDDIPVAAARRHAPAGFLIGYSADEPGAARRAIEEGADYLGCGTVYPTSTKQDAGETIGPTGLASVVRAVAAPVVGIGGITGDRAAEVAATGAAGIAVVGAVMRAPDVAETVRRLLAPWTRG
jgi:thiamine-phosphate diphosphorylase